MKTNIQILIGMAFIALAGCSTQEVKHDAQVMSPPLLIKRPTHRKAQVKIHR